MATKRRHFRNAFAKGIENHSYRTGVFELLFETCNGEVAVIHLDRTDVNSLACMLWQYLREEEKWHELRKKVMRGE